MTARILDGTKIANDIRSEVAAEVRAMAVGWSSPGLGRGSRRPQSGFGNLCARQSEGLRRSRDLQRAAHAAGNRDHQPNCWH